MRDVASDRREPGRGKWGFCPRPSESSWPWAPSCGHPTSGAEATELASAATPQRSRAAPAPADSAVGLGLHRQLESENRPVTPPASELRREPQKAEVLGCAAAGPLRGKRPGQPLARPASRGLRDLRCVPRGIQRVLIPPGRPGRRELPRQVPMALARPSTRCQWAPPAPEGTQEFPRPVPLQNPLDDKPALCFRCWPEAPRRRARPLGPAAVGAAVSRRHYSSGSTVSDEFSAFF